MEHGEIRILYQHPGILQRKCVFSCHVRQGQIKQEDKRNKPPCICNENTRQTGRIMK